MTIRMKKIGFILFLAMAFCLKGNAQDDAQFTLFPWATSYYNAGGIGEQSNTLCFTLMYDNKYVGWHDSYGTRMDTVGGKTGPQDFFLSIESYHKKLHGAIGLTFISDQIGFYQNIGVKLGYAYKLRIGGGHLGIGVQASLFNQTINKDGFDPLQDGDPVLNQLSKSTMDLDFSLGLMYKCDQWYAGVGVTQLVSAGASFERRARQHAHPPDVFPRRLHLDRPGQPQLGDSPPSVGQNGFPHGNVGGYGIGPLQWRLLGRSRLSFPRCSVAAFWRTSLLQLLQCLS